LIFIFICETLFLFTEAPVDPPDIDPDLNLTFEEVRPRSIGDLAVTELDFIFEIRLLFRI
jgi:hypothetical protein